jgi:UDP-N-acetyl-D-galactosamine dehydrogenase
LVDINEVREADCIVLAVAHDIFRNMSLKLIDSMYGAIDNREKVLIDIKSLFDRNDVEKMGYSYWRL